MGARINTIMQTCFFAISRRAAARRGHRGHQERHQEDLRQARRGRRAEELRRGRRGPRPPASRSRCPPTVTSTFDMRPPVPAAAPEFVQNVTGADHRRRRRRRCRSAPCPVDGTFPTATAQWEKRNIALEIPVWDAKLCIQCGKCVLVCPHAAIRAKVYDAERAGRRARDLQVRRGPLEGLQGPEVHAPGRAGGLHRLRAVRRGLPGQEQDRGQAQGHQHGAAAPAPRAGSRQLGLLPHASRRPTARRSAWRRSRTSSCCSRCSSSPAPAPAAARRPTSSC